MKKVLLALLCAFAAVSVSGVERVWADEVIGAKAPNPDPENIKSIDAGQTVSVRPRNDADDYVNLQWAFDHTAPGGTVALGAGTFFLGDGKASPRKTIVMRKGLHVTGERQGNTWKTVIRGGGAVMTPGVGGPLESGPIRIINKTDPHRVIFESIWFREWAAEVIFIEATHGFEFRNNHISHPANRASPGIRFVHALWSTSVEARGDFIVEDNLVQMGGYEDETPADDEQFMGIAFSNHDNIRIVNNTISGIDEAIEILGNRYGSTGAGAEDAARGPATIIVSGNRIVATGKPGEVWPSSFAILILGNLNVDEVRVQNNHVTKSGSGWGLGMSGENFMVSGNTFRFIKQDGAWPPGAVTVGGFGKLGPYELGSSLLNSLFENNTFEGRVTESGIVFGEGQAPDVTNNSHGNHFNLGGSLVELGAETTLYLGKDTYDNTFVGKLGRIVDNSPDRANRYE